MPTRPNALELKGRMLSITRIRVLDPALDAARAQIAALSKQMPQAVKGMPVVIDSEVDVDLPALLEILQATGMQTLGVSDGPLAATARKLGLAVVSADNGKAADRGTQPQPAAAAKGRAAAAPPAEAEAASAVATAYRAARVMAEPVRSGQQIYAEGTDLIVLNHVGAGAEVIADGCIHVYGRLSGRAIAGARGDENARIFCRKLDAELIAIAGIYAVAEQIKDGPRGAAAQAYLESGRLKIESHKV